MPAAWVEEGVEVSADMSLGLAAGFVNSAPDQLGLDGSEHGFDQNTTQHCKFIRNSYAARPNPRSFFAI